ncbi:MAG: transcriptional repressor [Lachnospiraceae bacterium]|nr:transcriptional repressor [Lachnospiraceae bacterium]
MAEKSTYKTKQREELISYLEATPATHITVSDVCDYFKAKGKPIGTTTVYRQLEKMVDEGLVQKYILDGKASACFEYTGGDSNNRDVSCFHCKCEKCGKLIHLHCDEIAAIEAHLYEHHNFKLNPLRTVFYGLCEECAKAV